jgi:ABC-type lipoprotein release transport system permease subunit
MYKGGAVFNFGFFILLIKLSWRSMWSHRIKSMVVGCIIFIGVFFLVFSDALLSSINLAMEKSLTWSITGHIQVYDANARDKLTMLGMVGSLGADPNVGRIENFGKVKKVLETHENVKHIVPMGTDYALVFGGNTIDRLVNSLREADKNNNQENFELAKNKLIDVFDKLLIQQEYRIGIVRDQENVQREIAVLKEVSESGFWENFSQDKENNLMYLETELAPMVKDREPMFLQFLATDLTRYAEAFPYFKLVQGEMIPEGGRGLLINQEQYDFVFKDRMARLFDLTAYELYVKEDDPIAINYEIQGRINRRQLETSEWILDLGAIEANAIKNTLMDYLGKEASLEDLFKEFIDFNDKNFLERKNYFYKNIAPNVVLYPIKIGDMITLNKFGNGTSIRLRFYGTYTFDGLQHSGFSGFYNIVDLTSFREMHGFSSQEELAEIAAIKEDAGVDDFSSDSLVDDLFGEDSSIEMTADLKPVDEAFKAIEEIQVINIEEHMRVLEAERYTQEELENGPVLSAAIILKDRAKIKQTMKELEKLIAKNNLQVQSIDWQQAAGFVGQMITVMQVVLYTFIIFVFAVATVIINNAMFMATIQRFTEIGTLRAIGASRAVIMGMFLCESILLALFAGLLGLLTAVACITYLGDVGIVAPKPEVHFIFGGERLYPSISLANVYLGLVVVFVVSVGATLYPAIYATRIPPVVAMNAQE